MSPQVLQLIPGALGQGQATTAYGEVGAPVPTTFEHPLVVMVPDWSTTVPFVTVTQWPADNGSALPILGDQVLLEQDSRGVWRVAQWGHTPTLWGGVTLPTTAPGASNEAILSNGTGGSTWAGVVTTGATAGGDLTGTYPNPTIGSMKDFTTPARASRAGALNTVNGVATKIPLDTLWYDMSPGGSAANANPTIAVAGSGNMDVVTNHRYNITQTGLYQVNYQTIAFEGSAAVSVLFVCLLYRNGAEYSTGSRAAISDQQGYVSSVGSDTLWFYSGDYVELYVAATGVWAYYISIPHDYNYLSISRVG